MTRKIFRSILLAAAIVLLASLALILSSLYSFFGGVQEAQIQDELSIAAAGVEERGADYLQRLSSSRYRLTWVAADGTVLYDTRTDAASMENHAGRAEIRTALEQSEGHSTRYSATLMEKTMYYAQRLEDGTVLRISVSRETVALLLLGMLQPIVVVLIVALILSFALAGRLSKRIVEPLNQLDLEHPLENEAYEELSPLLNRINRQHLQIASQLQELRLRTDEFAQITGSMAEGLVLLDDRGRVLSMNPAACALFGAAGDCEGQDFLTVDRNPEMSAAIGCAMQEGHSVRKASRDGKTYQFDISRITSGGETIGAVILAFDVTEQENAEQNRREFTANVSHELKTPLQGIIGSAELIENGLVKPEDMPRFIGHIRSEAQRLVTLIGDIIRLSQLDEGAQLPLERVDLLEVAKEAASDLQAQAEKYEVSLRVEGDSSCLQGVRRLLYEVIYNLCDNAIRYNVEGGSVWVRVASDEHGETVTVKDTGIGIPQAHQSRIFERFYRVDKSHSKASGGTGLGLSIVKHAVQYHHGRIELQSEPGKGTTIRLHFPKPEEKAV